MAIFKKNLNKSGAGTIFPSNALEVSSSTEMAAVSVEEIVQQLAGSDVFISQLQDIVVEKLLAILQKKYDFTPTDKYLEEVANKQKYISQLDQYLQERREINNTVENELQVFLQETTNNLTKALDTFTSSIHNRLKQAENRYGINSIKQQPLAADVRI